MRAEVNITKSFDYGKTFTKDWKKGDFEEFFAHEGKYLDRLGRIAEVHGEPGETFTVTYTITVTR